MQRWPTRPTSSDTLFPCTPLLRSVNPVIPEAVSQVVAQVYGNDAAVAFAGSQGNFELNVYLPVMARNLLESIRLLSNVSRPRHGGEHRSEEHTSELQSLMRISYAVFCLNKKITTK